MKSNNAVRVESSTVLCSVQVFTPNGTREHKNKWIKSHPLFLGDTELGERVVTPVSILGDREQTQYWMDAITGSLYRKDGRCLTSSFLHLTNVRKEDGLDARLKKINPVDKKKTKVTGIGDKK